MTRATSTPMPRRAVTPSGAAPHDLGASGPPAEPDFAAIQRSDDFRSIRRRLRRFIFPVTVLFCCWYFGYVLLAAYEQDFMSKVVFGHINMGLVLGLAQFVTTMVITGAYVYYMRKHIDPQVDEIRARAGDSAP